jgi:hypothetical protein
LPRRSAKRNAVTAPRFRTTISIHALSTKRNRVTADRAIAKFRCVTSLLRFTSIALIALQSIERPAMDEPNGNPPVWSRIHPAARRLGLSPDLMVSAARAGQLPIRIEQFGRGGHLFANTTDLANYINRLHPAQAVA